MIIMKFIGIIFEIKALNQGLYGYYAYRILFNYLNPFQIKGCNLYDGDINQDNYCILFESNDNLTIEYIENALENCTDEGLLPRNNRFLCKDLSYMLSFAGTINLNGIFIVSKNGMIKESWSKGTKWQISTGENISQLEIKAPEKNQPKNSQNVSLFENATLNNLENKEGFILKPEIKNSFSKKENIDNYENNKLIPLDINNLIHSNVPLTFLAGAGISMNNPSNVASARQIINAIIRFATPQNTWDAFLSKKTLRYEYLVQKFAENYDPNFKLMQYFEQITSPNLIHFFLADMISKGQYVITTNFDYLIEYAVGIENPKLKIVITQEDFKKYGDPAINFQKGFHTIYKIHGSLKNIQTGELTTSSLITTLNALGRYKNGEIFSVETFKREFIHKATKNRIFVILGYSGSDDFDIMPTLMEMNEMNRIIWITHCEELKDREPIVRIIKKDSNDKNLLSKSDNTDVMLYALSSKNKFDIIHIKAHTNTLISSIFNLNRDLNLEQNSLVVDPYTWINTHISPPLSGAKEAFSGHLFYDLQEYSNAMNLYQQAKVLIEKKRNLQMLESLLNNLGLLYKAMGNNALSLECHQQALKIDEKMNSQEGIASQYTNLAINYMNLGKIKESLEYSQKSYLISEKIGNKKFIVANLGNIGIVYSHTGHPKEALECYFKAIALNENIGDLESNIMLFSNIGNLYQATGEPQLAILNYEKAYAIAEKLDDTTNMTTNLVNLGVVNKDFGNSSQALEYYKKAYNLAELQGNLKIMGTVLGNIGIIHRINGEMEKSLECHQKALSFSEQVEDKRNIGYQLRNIGTYYQIKGNFQKALNLYQNAIDIFQDLKDQNNIAADLGNIGHIYEMMGDLQQALNYYQQSLEISEKIDAFQETIMNLCFIGRIFTIKGRISQADDLFHKSLHLAKKNNFVEGIQFTQDCIEDLNDYKKKIFR